MGLIGIGDPFPSSISGGEGGSRSEAKDMLGDDWVQRHRRVVQQHATGYQRTAWNKVRTCGADVSDDVVGHIATTVWVIFFGFWVLGFGFRVIWGPPRVFSLGTAVAIFG